MHTATIHTDPVHWAGQKLLPGRYWLEDSNAAELMHSAGSWGKVTLNHGYPYERQASDLSKVQDILVVRVGGFGDLLWCNAIYDALKQRYPDLRITHACLPGYKDVLLGYADKVVPYPLAEPRMDTHVYWLENVIESRACRGSEHPCDRLASLFGLEPLAKKSAYHLSEKERKWGAERLRQWEKKAKRPADPDRLRIAVQLESSGDAKSFRRIGNVMTALTAAGCDLVTVGPPDIRPVNVPANVYHCPGQKHTIRESIAIVSQCDAIVAPDSVFVHVGAALDIPVVGLYGPFDGEAYMQGQRGVAIQGALRCSPCGHHPRGGRHFPVGGPCEKTGTCAALDAVDLVGIVRAVLKWGAIGRESRVAVRCPAERPANGGGEASP